MECIFAHPSLSIFEWCAIYIIHNKFSYLKMTCLELQKFTHFKLLYRHQGSVCLVWCSLKTFRFPPFFLAIYTLTFSRYFFSFSTCCKCSISNHGFEVKKGKFGPETLFLYMYAIDVLWCQPIKLIQVVSTLEFHEYWC